MLRCGLKSGSRQACSYPAWGSPVKAGAAPHGSGSPESGPCEALLRVQEIYWRHSWGGHVWRGSQAGGHRGRRGATRPVPEDVLKQRRLWSLTQLG